MEDIKKEKKVIISTDRMFVNSRALVIEYHDVIRSQWFSIFFMIANGGVANDLFDTEMFQGMGTGELFEWYINRKHRIFLYDMKPRYPFDSKESQDKFYKLILTDLSHIEELYHFPTPLGMEGILRKLLSFTPNLVQRIYIYIGEENEEQIKKQMKLLYGDRVTFDYIYGDFKTAIDGIDKDCTYILSDIEKINILEEMNRISYSSILIPDGYRYNYKENDPTKLKVDIDAIKEKYMCRCALFNNFLVEKH